MLWVSLILFLVLGLKTIISEKVCEACVRYAEENNIDLYKDYHFKNE